MLLPCPVCRLPVQPGKDPNGFAWHDCKFVQDGAGREPDATVESIHAVVLRRLRDQAATAGAKDLIAILNALKQLEPAPEASPAGDPNADLVIWLGAKAARPKPRVV